MINIRELQLKEFNLLQGRNINSFPNEEILILRKNLIQEELNELKISFNNIITNNEKPTIENIKSVIDDLCDIQYVLSGTILEFKLEEDFEEMFNAVHESNMTKSCKTYQDALEQQQYYLNDDIDCWIKPIKELDCYVLIRTSDGKLLKPSTYQKVDLTKFAEKIYGKFVN